MLQPKLSVITIVYNNVRDIERTMLSVLNQTYPNIEYIIIDGASTDGTKDIIYKYKSRLSQFISEKDKGIYDAMNKGLNLATGADIYYGETEMFDDNWKSLGQRRHRAPESFSWRSFKHGMSISHQAIYVKRSLAEPYDLQYKYSSDIDWIIKVAKKASNIVNTHSYVAKYLVGGISKQKHFASLKERFRIFNNYYGFIPNLVNHFWIGINLTQYYVKHKKTND